MIYIEYGMLLVTIEVYEQMSMGVADEKQNNQCDNAHSNGHASVGPCFLSKGRNYC